MSSCELCWDGRHLRCGGRNGCTCGVCLPTRRAPSSFQREPMLRDKPVLAPVTTRAAPTKVRRVIDHGTLTVLPDDVSGALLVLAQLPQLLETLRMRQGMSYEALGAHLECSEKSIRLLVKGTASQGVTQKTLIRIMEWINQQDSWVTSN